MVNPEPEYLTTRELAELLRIKERKVYDLAAGGEIPCSRAMGKLLFPRQAIRRWLARSSSGMQGLASEPLPAVFLGSHDPLLDWAMRQSGCGMAGFFDGSSDGLNRFVAREGMATGLHLYDADNGSWNRTQVEPLVKNTPAVLVHWASRQRGLIVRRADNPIRCIQDLPGHRFAPRQAEAGAQLLFMQTIAQAGLNESDLILTPECRSEADVALAVAEGKADAAFGLAWMAAQNNLDFIPVVEEQFDLLVDRYAWFEPPLQTLLEFCRSQAFLDRTGELPGYDITALGAVRLNAPP